MTSMQEVRRALLPTYLSSFPEKLGILARALVDLRAGREEGDEPARRLAHQLRGTAASYGLPAISVAAAATERADPEHLEAAALALTRLLAARLVNADHLVPTLLVLGASPSLAHRLLASLAGTDAALLPCVSAEQTRACLQALQFDAALVDEERASAECLQALRAHEPSVALLPLTGALETGRELHGLLRSFTKRETEGAAPTPAAAPRVHIGVEDAELAGRLARSLAGAAETQRVEPAAALGGDATLAVVEHEATTRHDGPLARWGAGDSPPHTPRVAVVTDSVEEVAAAFTWGADDCIERTIEADALGTLLSRLVERADAIRGPA